VIPHLPKSWAEIPLILHRSNRYLIRLIPEEEANLLGNHHPHSHKSTQLVQVYSLTKYCIWEFWSHNRDIYLKIQCLKSEKDLSQITKDKGKKIHCNNLSLYIYIYIYIYNWIGSFREESGVWDKLVRCCWPYLYLPTALLNRKTRCGSKSALACMQRNSMDAVQESCGRIQRGPWYWRLKINTPQAHI